MIMNVMQFCLMTWHCSECLSLCPAATNHVIIFYRQHLILKSTACVFNLVLPCGHSLKFFLYTKNYKLVGIIFVPFHFGVTNIIKTLVTSNICHFFCISFLGHRNAANMKRFLSLLYNFLHQK